MALRVAAGLVPDAVGSGDISPMSASESYDLNSPVGQAQRLTCGAPGVTMDLVARARAASRRCLVRGAASRVHPGVLAALGRDVVRMVVETELSEAELSTPNHSAAEEPPCRRSV
jgi:hypothetical protein